MEANVHARRLLSLDRTAKRMQTSLRTVRRRIHDGAILLYAWERAPRHRFAFPKTSSSAGCSRRGYEPFLRPVKRLWPADPAWLEAGPLRLV